MIMGQMGFKNRNRFSFRVQVSKFPRGWVSLFLCFCVSVSVREPYLTRYRWSICTWMPDFVWWLRHASGIYSICQCLPCRCRYFICNMISPIHDFCIVWVNRWAAGRTSSFKSLNFFQLIFCHSHSESDCFNLFRLFPLQISVFEPVKTEVLKI